MNHPTHPRPTLICIAQYAPELEAGQMTIFNVIARAKTLGADGIELRREPWRTYRNDLPQAKALLDDLGLVATFASFNPLFAPDVAAQSPLDEDFEMVAALGAPLLRLFPGNVPASETDPAWAAARDMVERAASRGVVIALENFSASPGATLPEIQTVLERIVSPALGTNLDIGNYAAHGQDVPAAIRALAPRIVYAHLKDMTGDPADPTTALGKGTLPMRAILAELERLPQTITYCFEFAGHTAPDERITASLQFLRAVQGEVQ